MPSKRATAVCVYTCFCHLTIVWRPPPGWGTKQCSTAPIIVQPIQLIGQTRKAI